jgi:FKBP-type peptidyl-prolyl cis-trans isomerase
MKVVPRITFPLQNVIKDGLKEFPFQRGSGTLLIPSHLGMDNDSNGITGGSVLVFDVKLI